VNELTREGLIGWPAWYRKDFTLPAGARSAFTDLFTVATDEDLVRAMFRIAELRRRRR